MRASALEFRFRYLLHVVVFALGFVAPWDRLLPPNGPLAPTQSAWLSLASAAARAGWLPFASATVLLLVIGIVAASAAAALRTWASAFLGPSIVQDGAMHGNVIVASGPYRFLRNPLYLGSWLHALALALLMPPTGALFTLLLIALLQARLIGGEEAFLNATLGTPYAAYRAAVPRILPSLTPRLPPVAAHPHWLQAILGELYMIGVALSFLLLGWRYNARLLTQGVLVALGLSLVARAFIPAPPKMEGPPSSPDAESRIEAGQSTASHAAVTSSAGRSYPSPPSPHGTSPPSSP